MGRRDQDVHFLASKEEVQRIHEKMDELGIRSMGAYLRKMALDGYCINLDLQDVKELVSLLRRCVGQKENTPLSWRHILIVLISITISFITPLLWTVPVNSRTFFFPGLRFSD